MNSMRSSVEEPERSLVSNWFES
jgi:hypothetical protein